MSQSLLQINEKLWETESIESDGEQCCSNDVFD